MLLHRVVMKIEWVNTCKPLIIASRHRKCSVILPIMFLDSASPLMGIMILDKIRLFSLSFNFLSHRTGFITNVLMLLWEFRCDNEYNQTFPNAWDMGETPLRLIAFLLWEKTVSYFSFESAYPVFPRLWDFKFCLCISCLGCHSEMPETRWLT